MEHCRDFCDLLVENEPGTGVPKIQTLFLCVWAKFPQVTPKQRDSKFSFPQTRCPMTGEWIKKCDIYMHWSIIQP
jgi:hypothetical protein